MGRVGASAYRVVTCPGLIGRRHDAPYEPAMRSKRTNLVSMPSRNEYTRTSTPASQCTASVISEVRPGLFSVRARRRRRIRFGAKFLFLSNWCWSIGASIKPSIVRHIEEVWVRQPLLVVAPI